MVNFIVFLAPNSKRLLGNFIQNISGHNSILNAIAVNSDGVCVSGADNGSMQWFDWRTGYNFQRDQGLFQIFLQKYHIITKYCLTKAPDHGYNMISIDNPPIII